MITTKPRVFLGTTEIAGYYAGLHAGFRAIGVPVTRYFQTEHRFGYSRQPIMQIVLGKLAARYRAASREEREANAILSRVPAIETWLVDRFIKRHDIFIFGFMTSLDGILVGDAGLRDLERLRQARKTIICVFHGSEVRPVWLNGNSISADVTALANKAGKARRWLRTIEKYADVIVSHPPMAPLQVRPYAQYLCVGIPMRQAEVPPPRKANPAGRPFRIVHAPSNPQTKGTDRIRATIEKLRTEGYDIDLKLLIDVPNADVLAMLRSADLLIDQVFSDTPMAHLATEAATQGCPTVVCGHDLKSLRSLVAPDAWPPSIIGTPDELYNRVKWALDHGPERRAIGQAAHAFVSKRWQPKQVAHNFLRLARYGIPKAWEVDPKTQRFWGGYGMTLTQRDDLVARITAVAGPEALGLPDGTPIPLPRSGMV